MKLKNKVIAFAMTAMVAITTLANSLYATEPEPITDDGAVYSEINVAVKNYNGDFLEGIDCKLVKDGESVATWTTTKEHVSLKNISWGEYTVVPTNLPSNLKKGNDWTISLAKNGKTNPMVVLYVADVETKSLCVDKLNSANGEFVEGAVLQLLDDTGKVIDEWTTTKESYIIEGLPVGHTYTVHEKTVPTGFIGGEDETIEIPEPEHLYVKGARRIDNADYYVAIYNTPVFTVTFEKREIKTGDFVQGATLQLYKQKMPEVKASVKRVVEEKINIEDWTLVDEWTTDDKGHVVTGLQTDYVYMVIETKVPGTYLKPNYNEMFYLDGNGKVYQRYLYNDNETSTVVILNTKRDDIIVNKKDNTRENFLAGAEFEVLDEDGNVVESWTSTTQGYKLQNVQPNVLYTLKEVKAPEGYIAGEDLLFYYEVITEPISEEVREEVQGAIRGGEEDEYYPGKVILHVTTVREGESGFHVYENNEIDVLNEKIPTKYYDVVISKKDAKTGDLLAGAKFKVVTTVDGKETEVAHWTSGTEKYTLSLEANKVYTLKEVEAPAGYIGAKDIDITIKEKVMEKAAKAEALDYEVWTTTPSTKPNDLKKLESNEIVIENTRTKVLINKLGENKKQLEGATLEVKDLNGKVITSFITGKKAQEIEKLPVGKYVLHEVKAPAGYKLAKDVEFEVTTEIKTIEVTMTDEKDETKEIEITKYDVKKNFVEGAVLAVKDKNGKEIARWTTVKDVHKVNLAPGNYVLTEISAPSGYVKAKDVEFTVHEGKTLKDNVSMKDEFTVVEIKKLEEGTDKAVVGAKLELYNAEGKKVESWTTTSGTKQLTNLAHGKYTLKEVEAPEGYELAADVTFEVTDKAETVKVTMYDKKKAEVVVKKDEVKPVETKTVKAPVSERVQTGDDNNAALLIIVMLALVAGLAVAVKKIKK